MSKDNCVFCKIIKEEVSAEVVHESDDVVAFKDNSPSAEVHILIVPRKHIGSFMDLGVNDSETGMHMLKVAKQLVNDLSISKKYKVVINGGENQFVPHLHLHLLGGKMKKEI